MRVADWLANALVERGVRHAFMVSGGGAMYLDDAVGAHPGLEVVCTLHEQAAAIAAEAYWKASGDLALCLVTAGPGGTNAITGVAGGWLDSTPMVIVSGQVKRADLVGSTGVRQRGVQELDLVSIVRSITKYSAMVTEPATIRYHLERALHLATTGRPGPVWLDVPLDVQGATVNPATMSAFDPSELPVPTSILTPSEVMSAADSVLDMLEEAKRPLVLVGAGVRLAKAERRLLALLEAIGTPVITTWPAMGIVGEEHPLYVGRPGSLAPRGPNFALQASDVLLCLGARLDLVTTGYDPKDFGRAARKVVVDIDPNELAKLDGAIELPVCADVGTFIDALIERIAARPFARRDLGGWTSRCRSWRERYPLVTDAQRGPGDTVSTYYLAEVISGLLADDDVLVPCSSGLAIEILLLALRLRTGHRAIFTTALGAMGFGLPAAIGSCLATGRRRTICVEGDGGLQVNIQELETMRRLELPVKLFVLSNDGYASIRASQTRWFGRLIGADSSSGMTLPSLAALAGAYGLEYVAIDGHQPLGPQVLDVLSRPGPVVCEVPSPPEEAREPVQVSEALPDGGMRSRALEDLAPLLDRAELASNLVADEEDQT